ncbi:dynamin family protein [Hydrogenobacter thermophilus]|uniref:dynamin family protein n=1 Tax=Hydrogenobacter thermophilus TaxID=940 RepID=UPI0030FB9634
MMDLTSYERKKSKIVKNIESYVSRLKRCKKTSDSVKLPINFNEYINRLEGVLKSLLDDKVRVSVIAEVSNGKSTFLNALIFRDKILEARIGETTARLYHISYGEKYAIKYKDSVKEFDNLEDIKNFIKEKNTLSEKLGT